MYVWTFLGNLLFFSRINYETCFHVILPCWFDLGQFGVKYIWSKWSACAARSNVGGVSWNYICMVWGSESVLMMENKILFKSYSKLSLLASVEIFITAWFVAKYSGNTRLGYLTQLATEPRKIMVGNSGEIWDGGHLEHWEPF